MRTRRLGPSLVVLLGIAPLACGPGGEVAEADAALRAKAAAESVTVMTRNLYVGADVVAPLTSGDPIAAAAEVWAGILASDPAARMAAIADEIARAGPDVVGFQEAYRFEVAFLGTTTPFHVIDFLDELEQALPESLGYTWPAITQTHTVLMVPFPTMEPPIQVTMIDRDAILVNESVDVLATGGGHFDNEFATTIAVEIGGIVVETVVPPVRGWVEATLSHEGAVFTFVSTHLEVKEFGAVQGLQALELAAMLSARSEPLVVVGDMNSGPRDGPIPLPDPPGGFVPSPYMTFTSESGLALEDAWPGVGGFTCCFNADLSVPARPLDERVDLILASEVFGPTFTYRTGFQQLPGLAAASPPDDVPRWPSDHAGVVAFLGTSRLAAPEEVAAR